MIISLILRFPLSRERERERENKKVTLLIDAEYYFNHPWVGRAS